MPRKTTQKILELVSYTKMGIHVLAMKKRSKTLKVETADHVHIVMEK